MRFLCVLLVCASFESPAALGQSPVKETVRKPRVTRNTIYRWLYSQESLVRSMQCRYLYRSVPTDKKVIPLIRDVWRRRGDEAQFKRFIFTSGHSKFVSFWRNGVLHREDHREKPDIAKPTKIRAFDGQLVREYGKGRDGAIGVISLPETAHWFADNRIHPYSSIYQLSQVPYSTLVARGRELNITAVKRDGKELLRVFLKHPDFSNSWIVLFLDRQGRMVRRERIAKMETIGKPRVHETHELHDYQKHKDKSGRNIWFPRRTVFRYHVGRTDGGQLVEYHREEIRVESISFNDPIPGSQFVVRFPAKTMVLNRARTELVGRLRPLKMVMSASSFKFTLGGPPVTLLASVQGKNSKTGRTMALWHRGIVPSNLHPIAEVRFPNKRRDQKRIRVRVKLDRRTGRTLFGGTVRIPAEAGLGKATITLSFESWKEGKVVRAFVVVPVVSRKEATGHKGK